MFCVCSIAKRKHTRSMLPFAINNNKKKNNNKQNVAQRVNQMEDGIHRARSQKHTNTRTDGHTHTHTHSHSRIESTTKRNTIENKACTYFGMLIYHPVCSCSLENIVCFTLDYNYAIHGLGLELYYVCYKMQ